MPSRPPSDLAEVTHGSMHRRQSRDSVPSFSAGSSQGLKLEPLSPERDGGHAANGGRRPTVGPSPATHAILRDLKAG